jgi:hypothetical protein
MHSSIKSGASACCGKETFCTAQQQTSWLHFGSSAHCDPSMTLLLRCVERIATAIALTEEGI